MVVVVRIQWIADQAKSNWALQLDSFLSLQIQFEQQYIDASVQQISFQFPLAHVIDNKNCEKIEWLKNSVVFSNLKKLVH